MNNIHLSSNCLVEIPNSNINFIFSIMVAIDEQGAWGGHFPFFNNLRAAEDRVHLNNLG